MEGVPVIPYDSLDIRLQSKWNIIGGISVPTPTSSLTITTPTGIYPSIPVFYGYFPGYRTVTMLYPGKAYWMKIYGEGILHIRPPQSTPKSVPEDVVDLDKLNSLTVIAGESQTLYLGDESLIKNTVNYEMPPVPPAGSFDARFSSQSMLESYPASIEKGKQYKYTIELQRGTNPVTVQWNIQNPPDGRTFVISDAIGGKVLPNTVMGGKGSVHIANASVNKLIVKLVEGIANLPKAFALGQNYPNPFNPTTTFVVAMPKTADVDVSIYNILGQKVATLLSGMQPACYHTVEWNGTNQAGLMVPSGTYFVRMVSGEFRGVQKILLMK